MEESECPNKSQCPNKKIITSPSTDAVFRGMNNSSGFSAKGAGMC